MKLPVGTKYLFLALFQLTALHSYAQYYEQKPEPEIAIGINVVKGNIIYARSLFTSLTPAAFPCNHWSGMTHL